MTKNPEDLHAATHDKIKAIRHELHYQTKVCLNTLKKDFNTYVMLEVEDNKLQFIFRPDPDVPEELINVFTISENPARHTWMITTIGGDYSPKTLKEIAELAHLFNFHGIKNVKTWYN